MSDLPAGMHLSVSDGFTGVLKRHESLAANLGAKLVGPLLVKSVEKLFEGPIKILQSQYGAEGVSCTYSAAFGRHLLKVKI